MTLDELHTRQGWSLEQKIDHAVGTVQVFIERIKPLTPYVSFSGGKDSTVLLDLVRRFVDPNVKAVFCNTGNEWPEVVKFVRTYDNVDFIRPHTSMAKIIETYGFPLVTKETSEQAHRLKYSKKKSQIERLTSPKLDGRRNYHMMAHKWRFLADEEWDVSPKCCDYLKKKPFKEYDKRHNSRGIIATMASESWLRTAVYLKRGGCNSFTHNKTASYPLSIWTEKDIYDYISCFNIKLCGLYNNGFTRTGCMACGFGLHLEPQRLDNLKHRQPRLYERFLSYTNHGHTYKEALSAIGVNCP